MKMFIVCLLTVCLFDTLLILYNLGVMHMALYILSCRLALHREYYRNSHAMSTDVGL